MLDRRNFLRICAGSGAMALPGRLRADQPTATGRLAFRLKETAGLRRFSYPVRATLPARAHIPGMTYRLVRDGKEIPAQFREVDTGMGRSEVALDFTASPGPFETEEYVVEFGASVKPNSVPGRGLVPREGEGTFRVANLPHLTYTIPDDLAGLVTSIKTPTLEFLAPNSRGLYLVDRGSHTRTSLKFARTGNTPVARWTRQGPIAVGLRFEGTIAPSNGTALQTSVDLTFVQSKSWIETSWIVEDPEDRVESLGFELEMKLDGAPALVDSGASSTVYSHLRAAESLAFTGHPASATDHQQPRWIVEQGPQASRKPFATSLPNDRPAEGWIHLMDRSRCSALSVADFAVASTDRFQVESKGRLDFERKFAKATPSARPMSKKALKFWLHVVPMPVQIGAVTSPQAMLAPLMVDWME